MGAVNNGNQYIIGHYQTPLTGQNFGNAAVNAGQIDPGVLSGLVPSVINVGQIAITPGIASMKDDSGLTHWARVETQSTISAFNVDVTKPYVVLRYEYVDNVAWYADFLNVVSPINDGVATNLHTNDVILCKCNFTGPNLTSLDFNERSDRTYKKIETLELQGTKNGVNKVFTLDVSTPKVRKDQYMLSLNGQLYFETLDYTVSNQTVTLGATMDAPTASDDLRIILFKN